MTPTRAAVRALVAALVLAGCGPSRHQIRTEVVAGRAVEAEKDIDQLYHRHLAASSDDSDASGPSKHALLWRMERGSVDEINGMWGDGLEHFKAAARLSREFRTASATQAVGAAVINDTVRRFSGEPFEHAFIPYYGMLANLALAEARDGTWRPPPGPAGRASVYDGETYYDRAATAAVAVTNLQRAIAEKEFGDTALGPDPFLYVMAAAVRHATARTPDDRQAAAMYLRIGMDAYRKAGVVPTPAQALAAVVMGVRQERGVPLADSVPNPDVGDGQGTLLVLEELSFVPKRERLRLLAISGAPPRGAYVDLGGLFIWIDGPDPDGSLQSLRAIPLPGELIRRATGGQFGVFGFELPILPISRAIPSPGRVVAGPASGTGERIADLAARAQQCFDDHKAKRLIVTLTRTIGKLVAIHQGVNAIESGKRSPEAEAIRTVAWLAGSALATVSEKADTRCWTLLPGQIAATVLHLPVGTHPVAIIHSDGSQRPLGEVAIRAGGLVVLSTRSFPVGYNHAGAKDD